MPTRDRAWLVRRRLATQRLSGPALPRAVDAIRLLTAVQAQDAPMAAWSLGMRTRRRTRAAVLAEQAAGGFVRTHVLRPTWHLVAAEDLRWLLRLTAGRVESGTAGRHRQLGLDAPALGGGLELLSGLLAGGARPTRAELGPALAAGGFPGPGERVGHLLLVAELRGLICSGPPRDGTHTYALLEEVLPAGPSDGLDGEEAVTTLVHRFVGGHGPVGERDLARWCTLGLTEIRRALAALSDAVRSVDIEGETLWYDPAVAARPTRHHAGYLLPAFDEAFLSYASLGFPRSNAQVRRTGMAARNGGGVVVVDGRDIGMFTRTMTAKGVTVTLRADHRWSRAERDAAAEASSRLGRFVGRNLILAWE